MNALSYYNLFAVKADLSSYHMRTIGEFAVHRQYVMITYPCMSRCRHIVWARVWIYCYI